MNAKDDDVDGWDDELERRLRSTLVTEVRPEVRARHLDAIGRTLPNRRRPVAVPRRRVVLAAAAALVVLPVGAAAAAVGAGPGEPLYPVKLATEQIQQLVDPDVAARHRIEELEALVGQAEARGIEDPRPLEEARQRAAVAVADAPGDLLDRYEDAVQRLELLTVPEDDGAGGTTSRAGPDSDGDVLDDLVPPRGGTSGGTDPRPGEHSGRGSQADEPSPLDDLVPEPAPEPVPDPDPAPEGSDDTTSDIIPEEMDDLDDQLEHDQLEDGELEENLLEEDQLDGSGDEFPDDRDELGDELEGGVVDELGG